jgi:hypothetical protein
MSGFTLLCRWTGCRSFRDGSVPWCSQHRILALQHAASHRLDGHARVAIPDCPTCADPDGWAGPAPDAPGARPSRSEQCPNRGPALSHTQDPRIRADGGCIHCGLLVGP